MNSRRHFPTVVQALLLMGAIFGGFILVDRVIVGFLGVAGGNGSVSFYEKSQSLRFLLFSLVIGVTLVFGFRWTEASFSRVFPFRPVSWKVLVSVVMVIMGLQILLSDLDNLLRNLLGYKVDPALVAVMSGNLWEALLMMVILAPLTEELLFRGLILTGLVNNYSLKTAILASAVLFGASHLNLAQFFPAVVSGAVFGWFMLYTRSLWPCLLGHALNNVLPLLLTRVLHLEIPGYTVETAAGAVFQPWWLDLLGIGLAVAGLLILVGYKKEDRAAEIPEELKRGTAPAPEYPAAPAGKVNLPYGRISLCIAFLVFIGFLTLSVWVTTAQQHGNLERIKPVAGFLSLLQFCGSFIGLGLGLSGLRQDINRRASGFGVLLNGFYLLLMVLSFSGLL